MVFLSKIAVIKTILRGKEEQKALPKAAVESKTAVVEETVKPAKKETVTKEKTVKKAAKSAK